MLVDSAPKKPPFCGSGPPPRALPQCQLGLRINQDTNYRDEELAWPRGSQASAPIPCGTSANLEQGLRAFPEHSSADGRQGTKRGQGLLWQMPRPRDWQGPPRILCRVEQKPRKETSQTGWHLRQSFPSCGMPQALTEGALWGLQACQSCPFEFPWLLAPFNLPGCVPWGGGERGRRREGTGRFCFAEMGGG